MAMPRDLDDVLISEKQKAKGAFINSTVTLCDILYGLFLIGYEEAQFPVMDDPTMATSDDGHASLGDRM